MHRLPLCYVVLSRLPLRGIRYVHDKGRLMEKTTKLRASYFISEKLKENVLVCEWKNIGSCKGPLHVAHIDQNPFNNVIENLKKLCATHHRLMDLGKINPSNPVIPPFKTGISGKRRYLHTLKRMVAKTRLMRSLGLWDDRYKPSAA